MFLSLLYLLISILQVGPTSRGSRPLAKVYLPLAGPFPRPPPEGLPVVLGQFPPGPGWLEGPRPPLLELDLAIMISSTLLTRDWVSAEYVHGARSSAGRLAE